MRGFIVICLCATVLAAPQGYNYNQQQNSFSVGLPNFKTNAQVATTSTSTSTKTQEAHGFLQQAVNSGNLQQALLGGHNSQQFSTVPKFPQYQSARQQQNLGFGNVQQQQQAPLLGNFGQQQQFSGYQQHQQYANPDTVTKDIYVHVAPEDGEDQRYQQPALPPPPPRKHYRIVFIKAPSQNINKAALRIQQAPTEEKTIIYVLTKKPDPLDLQAAIQDIQPKQPSKPEVYFIKYKTQEEAQHAQRTIQAQYDQLGGTSQVSDEGIAPVASVIGSLDGAQQQQQQNGLDFSNGARHSSSTSSQSSSSFTSSGAINNGSKYLPPVVKL